MNTSNSRLWQIPFDSKSFSVMGDSEIQDREKGNWQNRTENTLLYRFTLMGTQINKKKL